ncbi:ent-kaurene oxidase [Diaporthe helianthi]|uniref:Ent-kaurene oxidase n=1 Tax=Diaporthe helianthi TaxID=158607 RepID=A0A2P5I8K4_DIAHE|nr:ent-kaurene oxidase [Diaporthe helianthi]
MAGLVADLGPVAQLILLALIIVCPVLITKARNSTKYTIIPGTPIVGRKWKYEPAWLTRYRFVTNGWDITKEGWEKVRLHMSCSMWIASAFTPWRLYPMPLPTFQDMLGTYTGLDILTTSHLSFGAVQKHFTPKIPQALPNLVDEIAYALPHIIGPCKTWTPIALNDVMTRVISHITARTWVGRDLARNEEWHKVNLETTSNIFVLAIALKLLPAFLQPVVAPLLPMKRKLARGLEQVQAFLVPLIEERKKLGGADEKPEEVIQWMLDAAEGYERDSVNLATRYVYAVVGSLFTVSAALVDLVYDITAYPEHLAPLREEVERVLKEDGGWKKGTPAKLEMMDSIMKESQRVNSSADRTGTLLSPVSFKRIVKEQMTLSDGLVLPKGAYIAVVNSGCVREDKGFDGFRYAQKKPGQSSSKARQALYTSTDHDHITFGQGRHACPGRFVAAVEIKLVLAELLMRYDFSFVENGDMNLGPEKRPKTLHLLELGFTGPSAKVYIKERSGAALIT